MKLYSTPTTCAISPHIVLRELGVPFTLVQVDLARKLIREDGADYFKVNPKGYVPALELDDGTVITEGAIIIQVLADMFPEKHLAPPNGTRERIRLQEWLHFIATELHKGQSPLYNPKANDEFKTALKERLTQRFGVLAKHLETNNYVMGNEFSVADAYALYSLRSWQKQRGADFTDIPSLHAYVERMSARPAVQAALAAEREGL